MTSPLARNPEWLKWATGEPPTTLDVWDGAPSLFLVPTASGAILWWQFDIGEDGSQYLFLAHLTKQEAQTVFDTRSGGVLEGVRANLQNDRVVVARRHPPSGYESTHLFQLPREYTTDQFFDWLDTIADVLAEEVIPAGRTVRRRWPLTLSHHGKSEEVLGLTQRPIEEEYDETVVSDLDRLAAAAVPA